jgi:hypothetical protein
MVAVAVAVQNVAASRAAFSFREPPAFFRAMTGPRIARSAVLLACSSGVRFGDF